MYPKPYRKMWFAWVKQLFDPFFGILRGALKSGMFMPVLGGVFSKRETVLNVSGDASSRCSRTPRHACATREWAGVMAT